MRVLFLTPHLPYPPVTGAALKSWRMVSHLASRHDLRLYTLLKGDDARHEAELKARVRLSAYHSEAVQRPRTALNFLRSHLAGIPLNVFRSRASSFAAAAAAASRDAEVIVVDHHTMFQYVPAGVAARIVLHEHNAEYVLWRRMAGVAESAVVRAAARWESDRIRRYEREICQRADVVLAAPNDIEQLAALGVPRAKFRPTLHLGDDALLQEPDPDFARTEPLVLFVGTLTWEPNADGLCWFLDACWPMVRERFPAARLAIVGRGPPPRLRAAAERAGAELPGFVDDLRPWYARARVFACPLRFGSGVKVKVINALYRGLPVVTSPCGAEGLGVDDVLRIAQTPAAWADALAELLADGQAWTRLSRAAREAARTRLSWEPVLRGLEEALRVGPC